VVLGTGRTLPHAGCRVNGTNSHGWPLTAFVVKMPDGAERTVEVPEQPAQRELGWFQAYVKNCRGWLDPQELLPRLVKPRAAK